MVCKIEGCECQKQEIPVHLMYWLTHHGIDIRPLFQKPYLSKKKKAAATVTVINDDQQAVTEATYNFIPVENTNVLEEFLYNLPEETNMPPPQSSQPSTSNVRRSVPYKVPTRRRV